MSARALLVQATALRMHRQSNGTFLKKYQNKTEVDFPEEQIQKKKRAMENLDFVETTMSVEVFHMSKSYLSY